MQDRKARLILNSVFSLLSWLTPFGLGLLFTPVILSRLGEEAFGVYLVILGFISYSFPFNIGRTVTKFVAEYSAAGEDSKINDAVSSGFWLSVGIGLAGAAAIAIMARWIVSEVLQVSPEYRESAKWALILGGFSIPVLLTGQVFQNVLQGIHRFGKVSLIANLNSLILYAGNVAVVLSGYGVTSLLAWNLATAFIILVISFAIVRSYDLALVPGFKVTGGMLGSITSYGFGVFSYQIFGLLLLLFERGWLLRKFGAAESAYYLLPMTLAIYLHSFVGTLALATFPAVNELLNDRERLVRLYQVATKVMFATTALGVATAICAGKAFLIVWVGSEFASNAYVNLVLHSLAFGSIALMIVIWQINEAHRAARMNALQVFVWGAVAMPLMIVASEVWCAKGMAAARLAAVVVTVPMLFYSEKRFLGSIFSRFWGALLIKTGVAVAALAVVEVSLFSILEPSWLSLFLAVAAGTAAFGTAAMLTGLVTKDEKDVLRSFLRGRFKNG